MPVKATTKRTSSAKNTKRGGLMSTPAGKTVGFLVICLIIGGIIAALVALRSLPKTQVTPVKAKTEQTASNRKKAADIQTYDYTEILENKELDTGSGVKITRNYEAESAQKEAAYRKELARKRREKQEALEAKARHEAELKQQALEKKRMAAEKKRQQQMARDNNLATGGSNPQTIQFAERQKTKGKFYIQCGTDNFRTAKEAESQKAKLAFTGKQSTVVLKQMGGGYVYSLNIGPYNSLEEAVKSRGEIISANLARNCSAVN